MTDAEVAQFLEETKVRVERLKPLYPHLAAQFAPIAEARPVDAIEIKSLKRIRLLDAAGKQFRNGRGDGWPELATLLTQQLTGRCRAALVATLRFWRDAIPAPHHAHPALETALQQLECWDTPASPPPPTVSPGQNSATKTLRAILSGNEADWSRIDEVLTHRPAPQIDESGRDTARRLARLDHFLRHARSPMSADVFWTEIAPDAAVVARMAPPLLRQQLDQRLSAIELGNGLIATSWDSADWLCHCPSLKQALATHQGQQKSAAAQKAKAALIEAVCDSQWPFPALKKLTRRRLKDHDPAQRLAQLQDQMVRLRTMAAVSQFLEAIDTELGDDVTPGVNLALMRSAVMLGQLPSRGDQSPELRTHLEHALDMERQEGVVAVLLEDPERSIPPADMEWAERAKRVLVWDYAATDPREIVVHATLVADDLDRVPPELADKLRKKIEAGIDHWLRHAPQELDPFLDKLPHQLVGALQQVISRRRAYVRFKSGELVLAALLDRFTESDAAALLARWAAHDNTLDDILKPILAGNAISPSTLPGAVVVAANLSLHLPPGQWPQLISFAGRLIRAGSPVVPSFLRTLERVNPDLHAWILPLTATTPRDLDAKLKSLLARKGLSGAPASPLLASCLAAEALSPEGESLADRLRLPMDAEDEPWRLRARLGFLELAEGPAYCPPRPEALLDRLFADARAFERSHLLPVTTGKAGLIPALKAAGHSHDALSDDATWLLRHFHPELCDAITTLATTMDRMAQDRKFAALFQPEDDDITAASCLGKIETIDVCCASLVEIERHMGTKHIRLGSHGGTFVTYDLVPNLISWLGWARRHLQHLAMVLKPWEEFRATLSFSGIDAARLEEKLRERGQLLDSVAPLFTDKAQAQAVSAQTVDSTILPHIGEALEALRKLSAASMVGNRRGQKSAQAAFDKEVRRIAEVYEKSGLRQPAVGEGDPCQIFDVMLSFAGENREVVEPIARKLDEMGITFFFDKFERVNNWGKSDKKEITDVIEKRSEYFVVFISKFYPQKDWPMLEARLALARASTMAREYILPIRLDDAKIPGLPSDIVYLDLRQDTIDTIIKAIAFKISELKKKDGII